MLSTSLFVSYCSRIHVLSFQRRVTFFECIAISRIWLPLLYSLADQVRVTLWFIKRSRERISAQSRSQVLTRWII